MIKPRISTVWSTTKPIVQFSCTPCVQEVHTKPEVVHPTPGLLGLGVEEEATGLLPIVKDRENPQVIQQKIDM